MSDPGITTPFATLPSSVSNDRRHTIPVAPTVPILGALPFLLTAEGIIPGITRMAERYRSQGLFRLPTPGGHEMTFVCNAELAEEIVDDKRWEKVLDPAVLRVRELGGDGLFTAHSNEEAWSLAHRILTPAFSGAAMERYFPKKLEILDDLLAHWRSSTGPVDVVSDMTKLTLDTISLAGFDHRFRSFDRPELDPFLLALGSALQELADGLYRPALVRPYEAYKSWRFKRDIATMFDRVDAVIAARRATARERWPNDLLSRMLDDADPKSGKKLDDTNVRYQIVTFLIAGHETTAGLLSMALHYVARDAALAGRLRDEVDAAFGKGEPTLDAVRSLDLVPRVLDETLRLHPPVPFVTRGPKEEVLLGGRHPIAKGQAVALLLTALHRDPSVWPHPRRFDPDRFLPELARTRPSAAYKPFGVGRRICTGRNFALVEAALALAAIVREFDLDDPGPLRLSTTVAPKPRDFRLRLSPRRTR